MIGINAKGTHVFCCAEGETEAPEVCVVEDLSQVKEFLVKTYINDLNHEDIKNLLEGLSSHDWEEGSYEIDFEIGGIYFSDVTPVEICKAKT